MVSFFSQDRFQQLPLLMGLLSLLSCNQSFSLAYLPSTSALLTRRRTASFLQASSTSSSSSSSSLAMDPKQRSKQIGMSSTSTHTPMTLRQERQTPEEQHELLLQAVELRRITAIEKELALKSSTSSSNCNSIIAALLPLAKSRATGYGDDLHGYERAVALGQQARETLVTRNMGLVHYVVNDVFQKRGKRYSSSGGGRQLQSLSQDDLVQEGAIGLARAVDRWDPEIGGKFSTYAFYWIRAAVLRGIAEHDDLVRVPEHVSAAVRKMTKATQTLGLSIDGDRILTNVYSLGLDSSSTTSWKEAKAAKALAEEAGLTDRQLEEAMKVQQRRRNGIASFEEQWMKDKPDLSSSISSSSLSSSLLEENDLSSLKSEELKKILGRFLRPKELEALSWRYGLTTPKPRDYVAEAEQALFGSTAIASSSSFAYQQQQQQVLPVRGKGGEAMSFGEVGKNMKVSAEYVRRLCHGALEKLRSAAEEGALQPALLF